MKKSRLLGAVLGCVFVCITSSAHAIFVSIEFTGVITELRPGGGETGLLIDPLSNYFSIGQTVSGHYIYDSSAPSGSGDSNTATYPLALNYTRVQIGTFSAVADSGSFQIANDKYFPPDPLPRDVYSIRTATHNNLLAPMLGENYIWQYNISLWDDTATALNSLALPETAIDPALYDDHQSFLNFNGPGTNGQTQSESIRFSITSMSTVVPIPTSVWLFGSGLLGLVGMARRKAS